MMLIWALVVRHDIPFQFALFPATIPGYLQRNFLSFIATVYGGVHYKDRWYGLAD